MAARTILLASAILALLPAVAAADRSFGVSKESDTKTRFVWVGADKNPNKTLYLVLQNGGSTYGTNVGSEIDVTFLKSDLAQIKWCSYVGGESDLDVKKCKPSQTLKPGGEIKIK